MTLVGTSLAADHARRESRRYNLATAELQAYLAAHPVLAERLSVTRIQGQLELDRPELAADLDAQVLATEPDVLGLSCYAWDLEPLLAMAARVRERSPEMRVVVGGPSASYDTVRLLEDHAAVDVAISGEGEEALAELLLRGFDDAGGVRGLTWRGRDGRIHEEARRPPVSDLATLRSPLLDGHLVPPRENVLLEFSRGCIYHCKHCAWQLHGSGTRYVPDERVRDEVRWLREHDCRHALIIDSAINNDTKWLETLVHSIREADPERELVFSYFANYRLVTPEQARLLSELRTHEILIGLESVNPRALAATGRKGDVVEEFARAVDLLAEAVGPVTPNVMFAMPDDDLDGFRRTMDFIVALAERPGPARVRHARVHWTIIPPGSYFWHRMSRYGIDVLPRGIPYVLGTRAFPRADIEAGLREIHDHPRADLFVWEDAEPIRLLGADLPALGAPGNAPLGGPVRGRIGDEPVLAAIRPLEPGRPLPRGWRVGALERAHGWPVVVLKGPDARDLRLMLRWRDLEPDPFARTASFDLVLLEPRDRSAALAHERRLLDALVELIERNDQPDSHLAPIKTAHDESRSA